MVLLDTDLPHWFTSTFLLCPQTLFLKQVCQFFLRRCTSQFYLNYLLLHILPFTIFHQFYLRNRFKSVLPQCFYFCKLCRSQFSLSFTSHGSPQTKHLTHCTSHSFASHNYLTFFTSHSLTWHRFASTFYLKVYLLISYPTQIYLT